MFNGDEIAEITVNTDAITGGVLIDTEAALARELRKTGELVVNLRTDPRYTLHLLVRVTGLPIEALRALPAGEYIALEDELDTFLYARRLKTLPAPAG